MAHIEKVTITKSNFAVNEKLREKLNDLVTFHDTLSPGLLTGATGCNQIDAMYILLLLYEKWIADAFLLIYHSNYPNAILRRPFASGIPPIPFKFTNEEAEGAVVVEDFSNIFIRLEFDLRKSVEFVVE